MQWSWYDMQHKTQLLIVLISAIAYKPLPINFLAFCGYFVIVLMNWAFYHIGGHPELFKSLSIWSAYLYMGALFLMLFKEKWKS